MRCFTEAQWNRLRSLLDEQQARIERQLSVLGATVVPASREAPFEDADLAREEAGERTNDVMLERYRTELAQLTAARDRMHQGRYGLCIDCGEPIAFLRLQAQPAAARCLPCQAKHERHSA
ncbi:TraR/DksA family transcriptional regulator [Ralstonia mannitolilytica]|uniref:RNA polymerase-binding transcription factor DksA n=1 Tax=Ralstonia mannitolilytica TaxID=105219 RepID=A0AAD2EFD0_9RALS|nr:TraR/DksA C4-type zinc finger protein [Ralstonia mannitolilytica]ATG21810.1 conjugal transfer protein TraR [Ralstonia pickettii]MBY4719629.1 TraR/DksA family transcriptional regulator [Ralstonia mannitolilytica]CAJ0681980.1 RNA polymerase-binding transcription factor DksA [Ralstonia mannitolilytica]CAJ0686596.1 RNA polymerase-binding transcription factor DksA [Ralstonia mannitolilytica]CAJ0705362.1 RNA polymerase-binding transcription factor DksA [Ralstonia mannitolilytica]